MSPEPPEKKEKKSKADKQAKSEQKKQRKAAEAEEEAARGKAAVKPVHPLMQPKTSQPRAAYTYQPRVMTEWKHTLFSCLDDGDECADSMCCFYCKFGWVQTRLERDYVAWDFAACCVPFWLDRCLVCPFASCYSTFAIRSALTARYDIKDGNTALVSACCMCCAMVQHARELTVRGRPAGFTVCGRADGAPPVGEAIGTTPGVDLYAVNS